MLVKVVLKFIIIFCSSHHESMKSQKAIIEVNVQSLLLG